MKTKAFIIYFPVFNSGEEGDGYFIWSGTEIDYLDREIVERGVPPNNYEVINEFPLHHWSDVLGKCILVHYKTDREDEIRTNLRRCRVSGRSSYINDPHREVLISHFTHNNTIYTIICPEICSLDTDEDLIYTFMRRVDDGLFSILEKEDWILPEYVDDEYTLYIRI